MKKAGMAKSIVATVNIIMAFLLDIATDVSATLFRRARSNANFKQ